MKAKTRGKRLLSILIACIMMLSLMPTVALAIVDENKVTEVSTANELSNRILRIGNGEDIRTIKLTTDIEYGGYIDISFKHDLIIDLNGHTLTGAIFVPYNSSTETRTFSIISSATTKGKMKYTGGAYGHSIIQFNGSPINVYVNNVDIEDASSKDDIVSVAHLQVENGFVKIQNSEIHGEKIVSFPSDTVIKIELSNVTFTRTTGCERSYLAGNSTTTGTISDILGANQIVTYENSAGEIKPVDTSLSYNTNLYKQYGEFKKIIIKDNAANAVVTFNPNYEGTVGSEVVVAKGNTLPTLPTLTREGYKFDGWYYDKQCTQAFAQTTPINANIQLYAKWTPHPVLTFSINDGQSVSSDVTGEAHRYYNSDRLSIPAGTTVTFLAVPTTNYKFVRCGINSVEITQSGSYYSFTMPNRNITLSATFAPKEFDLTFDPNDGVGTAYTEQKAGLVTLPTTTTFTAPAGKQFAGWSESVDGEIITEIQMTSAKTVYAIWKNIPVATVKNVTISGRTGAAITSTEVEITLSNDTFNAIDDLTDVKSWFTNLPNGLRAKIFTSVAANAQKATIMIDGASTVASTDALEITIPADRLTSGSALTVTPNPNAKFDIKPSAYVPAANTGLTYDGTEKTGVDAGVGYTLVDNTGTEAGDYQATATLSDGYVWRNGDTDAKTINWSIANAEQTAPTGLTGVKPTTSGGNGKITGTTAAMEYKPKSSGSWADCSADETAVEPGDYFVRYKEKTNYNAGANAEVNVPEYTAPATYTVTLPTGTGCTVVPETGSSSPVAEGGNFSFKVNIQSGYEQGDNFKVMANGNKLTAGVDDVYTISNITANQNVTVEGVQAVSTPPTIEIIEGDGQEWTKGATEGLTFKSNAAFNTFTRVDVDGETIADTNYTAVSGSTVVTLKASFLETLSVGEHTIVIVSANDVPEAKFTVKAAATGGNTGNEQNPDTGATSPQTGDSSNMLLWIALLFVSLGGLTTTVVYKKRKAVKE